MLTWSKATRDRLKSFRFMWRSIDHCGLVAGLVPGLTRQPLKKLGPAQAARSTGRGALRRPDRRTTGMDATPSSPAVARHRCAWGEQATAAPRGWLRPDPMIDFAELDATVNSPKRSSSSQFDRANLTSREDRYALGSGLYDRT